VLEELGATDVPTGYGWVRTKCFAHPDRTPSASVNHELNMYTCHSCGRSGDPLKLLQNELGLDFKEAVERARMLEDGGSTTSKKPARRRRPSDILQRG
jgi:hypothetical protein